ncbi:MAG: quinol:cytochrome C oxidoreductase, partial [Pirellulaceae bacterium]
GFTMFWAYIAFSQYLLIWYGNIPEETEWFLVRQNNGWEYIALVLIFGHFILPFLGLMSRHVRRRKLLLAAWGVWILVMHWIDIYWLVMPQVSPEGLTFGLIDLCCLLGIGGFYISNLIWIAADRPLVPVQDPWLSESLAFKQV